MKLGDLAKPDGGSYYAGSESGPTYGRRCADCKHSFSAYTPVDADEMYWRHIYEEHLRLFLDAHALDLVPEDFEI